MSSGGKGFIDFKKWEGSMLHASVILTRPFMGNMQKLTNIALILQGSTAVTDPEISTVRLCTVEFLGFEKCFDVVPSHISNVLKPF